MSSRFFKRLSYYIPGFIRHNFLRKLIAFLFAVLVYLKVSTEIGEEKVFQKIPIHFITHGNVEVITSNPVTVNVTIRTSKRNINLVTYNDIRVEVPISESMINFNKGGSGAVDISISSNYIHVPAYINVIKVFPSEITVYCERKMNKKVLVKPSFKGSPPLDYKVGKVDIYPKHVIISGPESLINEIKDVFTEPIRLDLSTIANFQVEKDLKNIDPRITIIPSKVQAKVEIYKALGSRIFDNIPIKILSNFTDIKKWNIKLFTKSADVTLHGPKSHLEILPYKDLIVFVDISNYKKPGTYEAKILGWCKDKSLKFKFIEPMFIKVEISKNIKKYPIIQKGVKNIKLKEIQRAK